MLIDELMKSVFRSGRKSREDDEDDEPQSLKPDWTSLGSGNTPIPQPTPSPPKPNITVSQPNPWDIDSRLQDAVPEDMEPDRFYHVLEELVLNPGMPLGDVSQIAEKLAPLVEAIIEEGLDEHLDAVHLASTALEEGYEMVSDGEYHVRVVSEQTVQMKVRENGSWEDITALSTGEVRKIARAEEWTMGDGNLHDAISPSSFNHQPANPRSTSTMKRSIDTPTSSFDYVDSFTLGSDSDDS